MAISTFDMALEQRNMYDRSFLGLQYDIIDM